jgi:putative ABC transport system permease protein
MNLRIIKFALRNVLRNRRRSLVTGLTVFFGAFAIVLLQAFVNGTIRNAVETSVEGKYGAIQVFRQGYIGADDPLAMNFADDPGVVGRIRSVEGVKAVAPRLDFDGMLSNGTESSMFVATAIDPAREYAVCPKRLDDVAPGGTPLREGDMERVLIGKTLAQSLGSKDKGAANLVMQAAGPHASTNALDVSVSGYLRAQHMSESKRKATVTLAFAQELLRMQSKITEYVVRVNDYEQVDTVAPRIQAALGSDYSVTTWHEVDPVMRDRVKMMKAIMSFVTLTLCLLVVSTIVNTTMMSVLERVREIGTMLAVGVRRRQVASMFLVEAVVLGTASAALGITLGQLLLVAWLSRGISGTMPGGDVTWFYPSVSHTFLGLALAFAVLGTALAALYPSWRASRLKPVDALRAL